jgi:hypothetical protein
MRKYVTVFMNQGTKDRRRARASSRGGVWRKPNPKMQGDVQEPDLRCGTPGTSGHVTTKSSIRIWGVLYKSGVYALKVTCLTLGDLSCALGCRVRRKLAEGRVIDPDRMGEVSRRHSRHLKARLVRHSNVERRRNGYAEP